MSSCNLDGRAVPLSAILDESPVGMALLDGRGRIIQVNRAYESLTGVGRSAVAGLHCLHALRCDYCMKGCPVLAGSTSFAPVFTSANILDRSRELIPVQLTVAPVADEDGRHAGYLETVQDMRVVSELTEKASRAYTFGGIVGNSPQIEKIFRMLPSVAQTDSSVLITGETGTGKDMLAEAIHKSSDRANGPFIKVNCGALPDTLLESELFGHTKGAFTGADRAKPGRFRMAHGGTLFLTEIGDLPLNLQVKLLSFLDDKVIYPLGDTNGFHADVRIIVATHRNLKEMVRQRRFRQDLLFRLNVIRLHLPPLRERGEDVLLLKGHFLKEFCSRFDKNIKGFSERAAELLNSYPYPGNVRELRNIVEYAVNFCIEDVIHLNHLPTYITEHVGDWVEPDAVGDGESPRSTIKAVAAQPETWQDAERSMIMDALLRSGGKKGKAAELLGWGRSTLWRKMKKYSLTGDGRG